MRGTRSWSFSTLTPRAYGSAQAREAPKVITNGGGTVDKLDISQSCASPWIVEDFS